MKDSKYLNGIKNLKLQELKLFKSGDLRIFIQKINLSSLILHLKINNSNTDGIEMDLGLLPNLRSLNLGFVKNGLDYNLIFDNLKALNSLSVCF